VDVGVAVGTCVPLCTPLRDHPDSIPFFEIHDYYMEYGDGDS
jgi:hypothetical protein